MRRIALGLVTASAVLCLAEPAGAVLGLGISTPTVTFTNFAPGSTASGSGAVVVTAVPAGAWTLKLADGTGHSGHMASGGAGCAGNEPQTLNPLSVTASGLLGSTTSAGPVTVSSSAQTVATGSATDTVTAAYSLAIGRTEAMSTGCAFSTTVTFTVQ